VRTLPGPSLARTLLRDGVAPCSLAACEHAHMLITGTDFITVATRDIDKAVSFYGDVLGLERSKQWGSMPAFEFETGNLTIAVMQSDAFGMEFQANTHPLEFHVDDYQAAKAELESNGVEIKNEIDSGVCHQAFFEDPDGNSLAIHHRYATGEPPAAA
jgi:catechol 2,3-dioxygenase-like lactoylglutathione lyase family enzyme